MNELQGQLLELDRRIQEARELVRVDPSLSQLVDEEIVSLEEQKKILQQALASIGQDHQKTDLSSPSFHNCTIEVRPGVGGEEAKIWGNDLLRMYARYAEQKNWKQLLIDDGVLKIVGRNAYEHLKYESGVHRVQRVPETEAQGRVHTSTASLVVLPEIPKTLIEIREDECIWEFTRAGGHGGQNVNKVSSAARLTHRPTGIVVESRQERHQERNRELALELLRAQLWDIEEEKRHKATGELRSVIGRAMRAEKIRTFNYPQNRVTDHRIHQSWYALESILAGNLEEVLVTCAEKLTSGVVEIEKTEDDE
ncbi:MAG: Peptide chain release factor 1 [Microgenomates group bacterium GW2011_GWF2_45_18]|nr:MAG: Peptide chain release factor 1 [Microgenomates group bacterium GW2011_GWF1_44_10]KKU01814.1 MAG: Peptide chain release factor 1 [Microgenomates group bacterium GW2011_GWF2_45_18]OGJ41447.1 MAG: hypothetical protein A2378_02600 [Candidatus Pacebacteria bacterium RIFOXYB1_FULL_44_10]HAU98882.1 peptide chain release factor 1 [Candidatus Paceibacterota bacterium]HAX01160.1 peptide chain release factor 1 [Candidatus Paceibacterota bacterium]